MLPRVAVRRPCRDSGILMERHVVKQIARKDLRLVIGRQAIVVPNVIGVNLHY